MLFFLRKLAEAMVLPIGLSVVLVVAGIVARRRWISAVGALVLYVFSIPITSDRLMRGLESDWPPKPIASAPQADAIVVLSGGLVRGVTAAGVQWGDSANRYFAGYDLAMAGKAKLLVFTGARSDDGENEGAIVKEAALKQGIEQDRIIVTGRVQTTADEAREVSRLGNIHSVLLVTSAFHMSRAALLFRAQGFTVDAFPTDTRYFGTRNLNFLRFVPTAPPLRLSEEALREFYGLAIYRTILWRKLR